MIARMVVMLSSRIFVRKIQDLSRMNILFMLNLREAKSIRRGSWKRRIL